MAAAGPAEVPSRSAVGEEMKVLMMDADEDLIRVVRGLLEPIGGQLVTASDGVKGIEAAHAERPDLILVDLHLSRVTGLDAVRILKAPRSLAEVPVIVMTDRADPEIVKEAADVGASDCLLKSALKGSPGPERLLRWIRKAGENPDPKR